MVRKLPMTNLVYIESAFWNDKKEKTKKACNQQTFALVAWTRVELVTSGL